MADERTPYVIKASDLYLLLYSAQASSDEKLFVWATSPALLQCLPSLVRNWSMFGKPQSLLFTAWLDLLESAICQKRGWYMAHC